MAPKCAPAQPDAARDEAEHAAMYAGPGWAGSDAGAGRETSARSLTRFRASPSETDAIPGFAQ